MRSENWMIYGAYGYTGILVAEEAIRQGHRPVLAGRSAERLVPLAERLDLPSAVVDLQDYEMLAKTVQGYDLVFHAAGPFSHTSTPMVRACLDVGTSYVDITGEVMVFEEILSLDQQARQIGVALIPGVGFDVVATDCLARYAAQQVSHPTKLEIATATSITSQMSPGTATTMLDTLPDGILARRNGQLVQLSTRQGMRRIRFLDQERIALPASLGDVTTAYRTTGIPNITTYVALPEQTAALFRWFEPIYRRLFAIEPLRRMAQKWVKKTVRGPDENMRQTERSYVWVNTGNEEGSKAQAWLETVEAYQFTALAGVRCVEKILTERPHGALTPALAFGTDFVLEIPGTRRADHIDKPDEGSSQKTIV